MPNLTEPQRSAVQWLRQDACVVAGPGSGKTTVLVERYRSLIEDHGLDPREILAITFTEKAAANMKAKLAEQFRDNPLRLRDLESAWVSTIHGFCARLLREHAIAAGIDPRFTVFDARESDDLQFDCLHAALDDLTLHRRDEILHLIVALQSPNIAGQLKDVYDAIRSAGKSIEQVRIMPAPGGAIEPAEVALRLLQLISGWPANLTPSKRLHQAELSEWAQKLAEPFPQTLEEFLARAKCPLHMGKVPPSEKEVLTAFKESLTAMVGSFVDRYTAGDRALIFDVLNRFDQLYSDRKNERGAVDFNDLERRSIELLRNNQETRERVRRQFRQVMLDEFQDINEQQAELIELVRGEDVFFAVGDVNQSIYGFRHARPEIFHQYQADIAQAGKHSAQLLDNFRSRDEILRCVERLLNGADGIQPRELIAASLFPDKSSASIEVLKVVGADKDEATAREARWIAYRILSLRGEMADFGDFAVLCRNSESMGPILEVFGHLGIPYVSGRRQSFLLSREGLDLTAMLHVIANPRDAIALATVLRSRLVGVGDESLLRLRLLAGSLTSGLNAAAHDAARLTEFDGEDAAKLERFASHLKRWRGEQPVVPLAVLISRVLSDCGIEFTDNIESFLRLARTRGDGRDLAAFLREIDSLQKAVSTESELSDADQGNCVQVMTAHAAKGLEFPVTIIAAMEKGTQRDSASVTFTPGIGLGLRWNHPFNKKGLDDSWQLSNTEELGQRAKQEGNRLLYVAMTRAEEHLILSFACSERRPSNWAKLVDDVLQPEPLNGDPPAFGAAQFDAPEGGEVLTIDPPIVEDQQDSTVNVTSLAVFAQCPRRYYLQRYIGWNGTSFRQFDPEDLPEETSDTPAAELGLLVHDLLAGKAGEYSAEAQELAGVFQRSELGRMAVTAVRAAREWDFIMDVDGTLVRGVIDLWFEQNGEIHIVDYKTDSSVEPAAYGPQLALYALALGKRPAHAWLHFLRFDQVVEVPIDEAAVRALIAQLKSAQHNLSFPLNEAAHCKSCAFYKSLCPAA
jgi:ATP-dependent helicase/nuclease subunit A